MDQGARLIADIQLYDKYARWLPDVQRRETWPEVVDRVLGFLRRHAPAGALPDADTHEVGWADLRAAMLAKDVLPSMRVVQMAGPALERCHVGAYNCAHLELDSPQALGELLYILMQGTGVGYSVERVAVAKWPAVSTTDGGFTPVGVIPDSTEGWCQAFVKTLLAAHMGLEAQWDYSAIRPEGEWLHTKGGRASGPGPLREMLAAAHRLVRGAAGRQLTGFEIHRLACMCGAIVQVGGVRRAALIALFDRDDQEMANCKTGNFWETMPELAMANNSMVFTGDVSLGDMQEFVTLLAARGTGEPGIFRRDGRLPERRLPARMGTNPCGEIVLRSRQFCNLSVAVARPNDSFTDLKRKVRLATVMGTLQSCLTNFAYLPPAWRNNCREERLLGVDITGAMDCAVLQPSYGQRELLAGLRAVAVETNASLAARWGIPRSAAITCNKPSGNSSQLLGVSSGIHARYAPYYIRRMRIAARSPLGERLLELGIPVQPETGQGGMADAKVWVFELPVMSPPNAVLRSELTAADQFAYWLDWKRGWAEHNPSCTIYVEPDEWDTVAMLLHHHWDVVGGLSFLPKDGGVYQLPPYEEISPEEYAARTAQLPADLDLESLRETVDLTTVSGEFACTAGGVCEF